MTPLTRQIGLGSALELTLWGDTQYDAERCYQLGWVQRVVPRDLVLETALAYARRMPYLAPRKVRNIKQSLYCGYYYGDGADGGAAVWQRDRAESCRA